MIKKLFAFGRVFWNTMYIQHTLFTFDKNYENISKKMLIDFCKTQLVKHTEI